MTLPIYHNHDLDLEVSRSIFEIALFQDWELIDMEWKECEHDCDLCVNSVGSVDVQDSDQVISDVGVPWGYVVNMTVPVILPL